MGFLTNSNEEEEKMPDYMKGKSGYSFKNKKFEERLVIVIIIAILLYFGYQFLIQ